MNLAKVLRKWRVTSEISQRAAAQLIGIEASAYSRIEKGEDTSGANLAKLLLWLMSTPAAEAPAQQSLMEDPPNA